MAEPVKVHLHPHALARLMERGASESDVVQTVRTGERFDAKHARFGFRLNFPYHSTWLGKKYATKQVEAFAVFEHEAWFVISVVVKFF